MSQPIVALILEDGSSVNIDPLQTVRSLIRSIERESIQTIVFGEVDEGAVIWEKQFGEMTVTPTSFGKRD